ncbi:MAG: biopolymer transporter ExbD [Pseudomonadota bacterium]
MTIGRFNQSAKSMVAMSDINVTPMVDVMLVLLVIFIITAPLINHAIKLDLPIAQSAVVPQKATAITLSVDAKGALYLESESLNFSDLEARMAALSKINPQPELQLRADKETRYEVIAQLMAAAQAQGLSKIGFITDVKTSKTDKK